MKVFKDRIWSLEGNLLPIEFAEAPLKDLAVIVIFGDSIQVVMVIYIRLVIIRKMGVNFGKYPICLVT